jgi:catechol 2,3-dioxygenase
MTEETGFTIHPGTHLGPVYLKIADLTQALEFYQDVLGLNAGPGENGQVRGSSAEPALQPGESGQLVSLSAGRDQPLIVLHEVPGARPKPPRSTGLYHFAILVPTRLDLAQVLRRLDETGYPLTGASDHGVSEALYLSDPDGNGIEIYRDRPREEWPRRAEELRMGVEALDIDDVLRELKHGEVQWAGLPSGTTIGHVHLHVADLNQAEVFYRDGLGFGLMQRMGASAIFVSAGGYHHHVGANIWTGVGAPPPPPDAVGLEQFTILLPDPAELAKTVEHLRQNGAQLADVNTGGATPAVRTQDPSGNKIVLSIQGALL